MKGFRLAKQGPHFAGVRLSAQSLQKRNDQQQKQTSHVSSRLRPTDSDHIVASLAAGIEPGIRGWDRQQGDIPEIDDDLHVSFHLEPRQYTHTAPHTHTHTRTNTQVHCATHTHTKTQTHTNTRTNTHIHCHTHTHTNTQTHVQTLTYTAPHTRTQTHVHTHARTLTRAPTHT